MSKFGIAGQNTNSLAYADNRLASVPCVEGNKEPTIYDRAFPLWTEWRITQNPLTGVEGDWCIYNPARFVKKNLSLRYKYDRI